MAESKMQRAGGTGRRLRRSIVVASACVGLLAACGSQSPEAMLDSAKSYLANDDLNAASIQLKNALQEDGSLMEARFLLGSVYLEQGDVRGAIRELRRAEQLGYAAEAVAPLLSRALLRSREFDQVIKEFEGVTLDDSVAQASVLVSVGDAYLAKAEVERAEATYQSAIEANSRDASARIGLGRSKLLGGDLDGAIVAADTALEINPDVPDAHALRADVFIARNQSVEAIAALESALKARPRAVNYHFALISMMLRENDLDTAEQRLEAMKEIAAKDPSTLYLKAFIDFRRDRVTEARDAVAEVVRLLPEHLPAQLLAGSIHLRLNDHVVAQRHLEYVLSRAPGQPLARQLLATSLLSTGDTSRASELMQPLLDASIEDSVTLTLAGQLSLATGDFGRASDYFAKVVMAEPEDVQARTRLGVSRLASGDAEAAFADLEAASQLDESLGQPDVALVLAHLRRGEFDKAMAAQQQLESKQPDHPQTHNLKGGILMAMRDLAGARAAFEKALELGPDLIAAAVNLARIDLAENRVDEARQRFEKIIASRPANPDAYLLLAELKARTGATPAEVRDTLERALKANPSALAPKVAMVRYHLSQKEPRRALVLAQEVTTANPDDPRALAALAQAQSAVGDHQQAIATLNTLVRLQPRSPTPLIALADAQQAADDKAGAERSLRRALGMRADLLEAQQRLFRLMGEGKRFAEGLAVSREIQSQRPDVAAGFIFEGDVHMAEASWDQAASAYRKALDRAAGSAVAVKLHTAQLRGGMTEDAGKTAADWLSAQPDDLVMRGYLAERALAERRFDDAESLYRRMLEIRPDNALVLNNLAWVAGQLERPDAIALAERAQSLAPDNAAIIDTLGMLQMERGEHDKGLANLRRAVEIAPQLAALRLNLAKAYITLERKEEARRELDEILTQVPEGSPLQVEADRLKQAL